MADHSVIAQDWLHESEASWASEFGFDSNVSPGKSCFVDDLVRVFLLLFFAVPFSLCLFPKFKAFFSTSPGLFRYAFLQNLKHFSPLHQ